MNWFLKALKQYVDFKGRARRKEYWNFALFASVIGSALGLVGAWVGDLANLVPTLFLLAMVLPGAAACVRRLHDIGKSGWWGLLSLIPVFGWIPLFVLLFRDGERAPNRFGDDPKATVV